MGAVGVKGQIVEIGELLGDGVDVCHVFDNRWVRRLERVGSRRF